MEEERYLIFPDKVEIQLLDPDGQPYLVEDVTLIIRTFARYKNDYHLGPFFSNKRGLVTITKEALKAEVAESISYALMDYVDVNTCYPLISIYLIPQERVNLIIDRLQAGRITERELELWNSAEELMEKYKNSGNKDLRISDNDIGIRDEWDSSKDEYAYTIIVYPKSGAKEQAIDLLRVKPMGGRKPKKRRIRKPRQIEGERFHEERLDLVVSDAGYSMEIISMGRGGYIRYSEGPRTIKFPYEILGSRYTAGILVDTILIWNRPYQHEVVDITKRNEIEENIRRAFRFYDCEVDIANI